MVDVSCQTWSPFFSWSMRKLAPAKWGFPFEVEDSSWSPESSVVGKGGQQSAVVVGHRFRHGAFWRSWTWLLASVLNHGAFWRSCTWLFATVLSHGAFWRSWTFKDRGDEVWVRGWHRWWLDRCFSRFGFLPESGLCTYKMSDAASLHFNSKWWEIHKIGCFSQMLPSWPELKWQQLFSWDFTCSQLKKQPFPFQI